MVRISVVSLLLSVVISMVSCARCTGYVMDVSSFQEVSARELQTRMIADKTSSMVFWYYAGAKGEFQHFVRQAGPARDFCTCFKVKDTEIGVPSPRRFSPCQDKWTPIWWGAISIGKAQSKDSTGK